MGKLGIALLNALATMVIAVGWTVTKVRMGFEWLVDAYRVGAEAARGVIDSEGS